MRQTQELFPFLCATRCEGPLSVGAKKGYGWRLCRGVSSSGHREETGRQPFHMENETTAFGSRFPISRLQEKRANVLSNH